MVESLGAFCHLDGSVTGSILATFATEPIRMQMGVHSQVMSFIVAPGMERPLVWLKQWNPYVNWRAVKVSNK